MRTLRVLNAAWSVSVCCAALLFAFAPRALAVDAGSLAPEIGLRDLQGRLVQLSSLKGKVVLVDFWASWCGPCKKELPVLEALYNRHHGQGLEIVGINLDDDPGNVRKFLRAVSLTFPVVHDRGGVVAGRYAPPKMPSSYLLDRKGVIRHVHAGFKASDQAKLDQEIAKLLSK